ncbi:MAG TPA: DNA-3-methyladenine glycosylase [Firmicutes bacterium]|nr:DNA-3-methyladenine glycosylase [Bacillota bacterium]
MPDTSRNADEQRRIEDVSRLEPLDRQFYMVDGLTLAKSLIGKLLVHDSPEGLTAGVIVETEAYMGPSDRAAHTWRGRRTHRTEVQFGPGGHAYVYFIYGMHYCFNVVANAPGIPEVALVRALDPVAGLDLMARRSESRVNRMLCSGPGRLCRAMGIGRQHNGIDLCGKQLFVCEPPASMFGGSLKIQCTSRIGIDYAGEAKNYPWRFVLQGNPCVTKMPHSKGAPGRSRPAPPEA